jgi:hypothetical protein
MAIRIRLTYHGMDGEGATVRRETGWTLDADKILKLARAARAVEILLDAIAHARDDEGEEIPDWLDEAEDSAIDALRSGETA